MATITGTAENDTLNGTFGNDELIANGGIDIVNAGDGDDSIVLSLAGISNGGEIDGGEGDDTIVLRGADWSTVPFLDIFLDAGNGSIVGDDFSFAVSSVENLAIEVPSAFSPGGFNVSTSGSISITTGVLTLGYGTTLNSDQSIEIEASDVTLSGATISSGGSISIGATGSILLNNPVALSIGYSAGVVAISAADLIADNGTLSVSVGGYSVPNSSVISISPAAETGPPMNTAPEFTVGDGQILLETDFSTSVSANATLQVDGKLLITASQNLYDDSGDITIYRLNPDGSVDGSFGTNGVVRTDIAGTHDHANALVVQPDGKILAVGVTDTVLNNFGFEVYDGAFALVRYNQDGTLDTTFGNDGIVTTMPPAWYEQLASAVLLPDGKILAIGSIKVGTTVVKYNNDGSLDQTFGIDGIGALYPYSSIDHIATQSDGKILTSGTAYNPTTQSNDFWLTRFNSDGSLDVTFNGTGGVIDHFSDRRLHNLLVTEEGDILVVGGSPYAAETEFTLAKYTGDGVPDTSFGSDGYLLSSMPGYAGGGFELVEQADGKFLVASHSCPKQFMTLDRPTV